VDPTNKQTPTARGRVYVLIDPAMPGLVKIGWTAGTSEERAQQLSAVTGVAASFAVAYDEAVADPIEAEKRIHQELIGFRYNRNREFFKISVNFGKDPTLSAVLSNLVRQLL
jgi:hypothetical protein